VRNLPRPLVVTILGAGALGCALGAALVAGGAAVTLIEPDPAVARPIAAGGVQLGLPDGGTRVVSVPIVPAPTGNGPVDLVLICVRYWHTEAAVRAALPLIGPRTVVLTAQGGWGDADLIAGLVGPAHTALAIVPAAIVGDRPGHVQLSSVPAILLGPYAAHATVAPLRSLAAAFSAGGWTARLVADARHEAWRELALAAPGAPLCALLGYAPPLLLDHAGSVDLMRAALREIVAVAAAEGVLLDLDECWRALTAALTADDTPRGGRFLAIRRDLERLSRSDVDRLNGAIVAAGRRHGIATPYNETILWLIRAQERRDDGIQ
jgi:2-dehydropantoate 2-reductase